MNIAELETTLDGFFAGCVDYKKRTMTLKDGKTAFLCDFKDLTDRRYIAERIVLPLLTADRVDDLERVVQTTAVTAVSDIAKLREGLLFGNTLVALEGEGVFQIVLCATDEDGGRDIQEPNSDVTLRGPRAGFTENYEKNIAAIRRIIRNEALAFEEFVVSEQTSTRVVLAYINGVANAGVVDGLRKKLAGLNTIGIVDSANLEMLLSGRMLFPVFGSTEKVDKVASKLLAGRVAVFVDGSPFVLTAPYVFAESLQSAEDYLKNPVYATAMRLLRVLALLLSLYFPAMYITVLKYGPELLPDAVTAILRESREGMPLEPFFEIVIMLVVFELLREVGIRMPRTVGDAATQAGLASTVVVVVVAITAVCTFIVPMYMNAQLLFRFVFLFAGYFFSFFGVIAATLLLLAYLAQKESFGVSYLSPLAPVVPAGLLDFLLALPRRSMRRRDRLVGREKE